MLRADVGRRRPYPSDLESHRHGACILEGERGGEGFTLFERLLQAEEHEVVAIGRERDGASGRHRYPIGHLTHFHHAIGHAHLMDLGTLGDVRCCRDEPVWRGSDILDGEIAYADFRPARRCPRPRRLDGNVPSLELSGGGMLRGRRGESDSPQRHGKANMKAAMHHGPGLSRCGIGLQGPTSPRRDLQRDRSLALGTVALAGRSALAEEKDKADAEADRGDAEDDKDKGDAEVDKGDAEDKDKADAEDKDKADAEKDDGEDKDKADAEADKGEAERDAD